MINLDNKLKEIKAFVFDVDGVFSTNIFLHHSGDMLRSMNTKDGFAVQYAAKNGYLIGIITGGSSELVRKRFSGLGITDIYIKSTNKIDDFEDFMYKYNLKADEILYMGDDIPDYEVMKIVGLPTCPLDAVEDIKLVSKYISDKNGGEGCVRDVIERVLKSQEKWII